MKRYIVLRMRQTETGCGDVSCCGPPMNFGSIDSEHESLEGAVEALEESVKFSGKYGSWGDQVDFTIIDTETEQTFENGQWCRLSDKEELCYSHVM